MMIKKKLGLLAGSLLLASGSHAAITAGDNDTDSSVIIVLLNATGSFVVDAGVSSSDLLGGNGFQIDLTSVAGFGTFGGFGFLPVANCK